MLSPEKGRYQKYGRDDQDKCEFFFHVYSFINGNIGY